MEFQAAFYEPLKPEKHQLNAVKKEEIMNHFEQVPWKALVDLVNAADLGKIYHQPAFEVENTTNRNSLWVSTVNLTDWYIIYTRPKRVKIWFGLTDKMKEDHMTDVEGKSIEEVKSCLNALLNNDLSFLESYII